MQAQQTVDQFLATLAPGRPASAGWVLTCCPFHEDRHPSFSYNVELDRWKCFAGCGGGKLSLAARYGPRP